MPSAHPLYTPYRALGLVCDGSVARCSPVLHRQGTATFLTTPVCAGRALHLYDVSLQLKLVSKPFPSAWPESPISCLAAAHDLTFVALGSDIAVLKRLAPVTIWHGHDAPVRHLFIAGDVLVSSCEDNRLIVWSIPSSTKRTLPIEGAILADITLPPKFELTAIAHPPTYLNKVLLGASDGRCILLNLRTKKIIHEFDSFPAAVTILEPSPVLDVVAVGLADGRVLLHNFRANETVAGGLPPHAVAAVSFRSDGTESLVSTDFSGNLFTWDLNERRLSSELRGVHAGGASLCQFLLAEPVLFTSGLQDNSVKVHVYDGLRREPRVLRSREGHRLPPTLVRFCGYDGSMMVSAGLDRELRMVSIVREARNKSLAQKGVEPRGRKAKKRRRADAGIERGDQRLDLAKKLPPITSIASNNLRQRDEDFANIATVHSELREVYTWRMQDGATHSHVLLPPDRPEKYQLAFRRGAKHLDSKNMKKRQDGRIHSYNLQSGKHQGTCLVWEKAHSSPVAGLAVDGCGDVMVSAGYDDCLIKFWDIHGRLRREGSIQTPTQITKLIWCTASDLLAVTCDDFCIYVYDASTKKLARKFSGHAGSIVDMNFDPLGRRIISASMDSTIKTWDLPSGRIIDTLLCVNAPTSVAVAPSGEYLASTHVNDLGLSLWVDTSKFASLSIPGQGDEDDDVTMLGSADGGDENSDSEQANKPTHDKARERGQAPTIEPLSSNIATLSAKPLTHWTTLSNLQAIKERNKPVEPAKKPEAAPFFLPTVKGIKMEFNVGDSDEVRSKIAKKAKDRKGGFGDAEDDDWANSEFGRLVAREQYGSAAKLLHRLDASGVDLEIQTLDGPNSRINAARFFQERLGSPEEYELTQAHLNLFLTTHGTWLAKDEGGPALLESLCLAQEGAWQKLRTVFDTVMSLSATFSGQVSPQNSWNFSTSGLYFTSCDFVGK
ncbi:WD40-repeat containing protein [Chondrus crispus]|uniref:WD40-repeat containing protein n=1 Tax=Chondrus crispus TaxID=2769 RepID=R7QPH4_CHOCR|nr:WD40-repeat containing protein [Chondrus crispus]CDF39678.1 WD40-repeat containing protein [Chondrus crispus]|eukprot:XP_005709972.1 WD40-repeat containing protein [Chondrus crispus]